MARPESGQSASAIRDLAALRSWLDRFEGELAGRHYFGGEDFGIRDVTAYPFLRYGSQGAASEDTDPFHRVLAELARFDVASHERLFNWVERVSARPQA